MSDHLQTFAIDVNGPFILFFSEQIKIRRFRFRYPNSRISQVLVGGKIGSVRKRYKFARNELKEKDMKSLLIIAHTY